MVIKHLLRSLDMLVIFSIAVIAVILAVLDFFNCTDMSWLDYPLFTLLLMGIISIHLIVTHFRREDFQNKMHKALTAITDKSRLENYQHFESSIDLEGFLAKRMLEAQRSVCDLTWKASISPGFSATKRQVAHDFMDKAISLASDRIPYREIFVFSDIRRIEKLERRLSETKNGYSCRYFKDDSPVPRLQFVLIDELEVFFFAVSSDSPLCYFKSAELSAVLKSFFEVAWNSARSIKEGPSIDNKELERIMIIKEKLMKAQ